MLQIVTAVQRQFETVAIQSKNDTYDFVPVS